MSSRRAGEFPARHKARAQVAAAARMTPILRALRSASSRDNVAASPNRVSRSPSRKRVRSESQDDQALYPDLYANLSVEKLIKELDEVKTRPCRELAHMMVDTNKRIELLEEDIEARNSESVFLNKSRQFSSPDGKENAGKREEKNIKALKAQVARATAHLHAVKQECALALERERIRGLSIKIEHYEAKLTAQKQEINDLRCLVHVPVPSQPPPQQQQMHEASQAEIQIQEVLKNFPHTIGSVDDALSDPAQYTPSRSTPTDQLLDDSEMLSAQMEGLWPDIPDTPASPLAAMILSDSRYISSTPSNTSLDTSGVASPLSLAAVDERPPSLNPSRPPVRRTLGADLKWS